MPMLKKIFFLCLFIFLATLLFWGVYNISFKEKGVNSDNSSAISEPEDESGVLDALFPEDNSSKIKICSNEAVLAPLFSESDSRIRYFSKNTGKVFETNLDGADKKSLSTNEFSGLISASWSVDGKKAIVKTKNPDNSFAFYLYDPAEDAGIPIKKNVDEVSWQTNASRIIYKYYDLSSQERTINVSDPEGQNWKKLADIPYRYVSIAQIPKSGLISFWNSGDAYEETIFRSVPVIGGESESIFEGKFGADYLWSPSGENVLASHSDAKGGRKMQLAILNNNGGEYKNLEIPTFVSKCVWSRDNENIYYALPGGISENAVLPNDYKDGTIKTADTFWKVNINSGEKIRLVETEDIKEKFDATELFLNQDESLIFFVNRIDGKLHRIAL